MVRAYRLYDDDVQLAGVFVLPGEVSATKPSIAGQGLHERIIGTQVCVSAFACYYVLSTLFVLLWT